MSFAAIVLTGFSIGFLGSLHCVGMCGPIAFSMLQNSGNVAAVLLYNLGRALSYAFMGLVLGLIGNQFALAGYQQGLSIASGILILVLFFASRWTDVKIPYLASWQNSVRNLLSGIMSKPKTYWFPFELGLVNAWLPCGLVYLALLPALATGNAYAAAGLMFSFGLGTMPLMILLLTAGTMLSVSIRQRINRYIPYLILITACLLILRGLGLGIPYLSPSASGSVHCAE